MNVAQTQQTFLTCYRGTQSALRHAAYMRMSKVLLLQYLLAKWNVSLEERRVFDYGFGAGTFFRYCPHSSHLFGVELDPICVKEVAAMLFGSGYRHVQLEPLQKSNGCDPPLLKCKYDVIICSHVLEHLPDPQDFLKKVAECLGPSGVFAGLVPINERRQDPHHVRQVNLAMLKDWLRGANLELIDWIEADPWLYWLQPAFTYDSPVLHRVTQILSLALGVIATGLGYHNWFRLSRVLRTLSRSKPTQAAFLLRSASIGRPFLTPQVCS